MITLFEKKFSTAAAVLSMMWGLLPVGQGEFAFAQTASTASSSSEAHESLSAPTGRQSVFVANAPDQHVVVRGDTLWGIAGKYLTKPWRWPEVWQMNREQIRNPHWIYPGQVIIIDKLHGTMRLAGGSSSGNTVYLHPSVRVEQDRTAIPSIPQDVIAPFLARPLVVDSAAMLNDPRIIAAKGDRVVLARGDEAYVAGITDPAVKSYQIFRRGIPLKDPDTGEVLAYQADYLGVAQVVRPGDPATVAISSFTEEINIGDRLVPAAQPILINYVPHAPTQPIHGRVINTYAAVGLAGRDMVVSINRGTKDGLEVGNVLAVKTKGRVITDTTNDHPQTYTLPDERDGLLFVFRLFDRVSYALVLDSKQGVEAGDVFTQP